MTELPAEVQAALDAYLAARGDDATWAAYVDSLRPGVALDIATDLCYWTVADAAAAAWIAKDFVSDPANWEDPAVPEPPLGLTAYHTLADVLENDPELGSCTIVLHREAHAGGNCWNVTYTVRIEDPDYETEGTYRADESLADYARECAALRDGVTDLTALRVDPWAVAACRAICHAWAPEWAQSREVRADAG